jgi:hypothetical protein
MLLIKILTILHFHREILKFNYRLNPRLVRILKIQDKKYKLFLQGILRNSQILLKI